jgi:hypothetical protein
VFDGACDCEGNVADCAGECGGSAEEDECGECGGDGFDCDGDGLGSCDSYSSNYNSMFTQDSFEYGRDDDGTWECILDCPGIDDCNGTGCVTDEEMCEYFESIKGDDCFDDCSGEDASDIENLYDFSSDGASAPECILDCPGIDEVYSEGVLPGGVFCDIVNSWSDTNCLDDCDSEDDGIPDGDGFCNCITSHNQAECEENECNWDDDCDLLYNYKIHHHLVCHRLHYHSHLNN